MSIQNIIIDNGSGVLKAGVSGQDMPTSKFPAIIGRPGAGKSMPGIQVKEEYIGQEALDKAGICNLENPIANGIVQDWDQMNKVWNYTFENELRVDPSECNVMLTEAPLNPRSNREKMVEIMFETNNVQGMFVAIQAVLSLYANGRTTGVVCDSGDGVTHTVPVFEGFQIPHGIKANHVAGREITKYMNKLLVQDGIGVKEGGKSSWLQSVRDMKEKLCFVALDYDQTLLESKSSEQHSKEYSLGDGTTFTVNRPRFMAGEGLFKPDMIIPGAETSGIHILTNQSIQSTDPDVRKDLYKNIILSGGSTLYEGLPERLAKEMDILCPAANMVDVIAPPDRYYSVWKGGSVLSSLATFSDRWITREMYDNEGSDVVHSMC